jgi:hypothetical protein
MEATGERESEVDRERRLRMIEIKLEMKGNIVFSSFPLSYEVVLPNGY